MAVKEFTVPVKGVGKPDYSTDISHAGVEIDPRIITDLSDAVKDALSKILSRVTEFSSDSGTATGGSQTTCVDSAKNWETDMWKGAVIEIYSVADDIYYLRTISGNNATTITHAALPGGKAVASGDSYAIRLTIGLVDLDKVGGTALTGRDISLDLAKLIPIAKAAIFNTALPAAEANWVGTDITPTNSPSYLRIYACVSVTGILRVARTVGGVTVTEDLNSGADLVAGAAYLFTVPWRTGDGIDIRYSVTTGTINRLLIDEIGAAE